MIGVDVWPSGMITLKLRPIHGLEWPCQSADINPFDSKRKTDALHPTE